MINPGGRLRDGELSSRVVMQEGRRHDCGRLHLRGLRLRRRRAGQNGSGRAERQDSGNDDGSPEAHDSSMAFPEVSNPSHGPAGALGASGSCGVIAVSGIRIGHCLPLRQILKLASRVLLSIAARHSLPDAEKCFYLVSRKEPGNLHCTGRKHRGRSARGASRRGSNVYP